MKQPLALIGFGEAGATFAAAASWRDRASAYDIDPGRRVAILSAGVSEAVTPAAALAGARIVLSLVTADQAFAAARDYAPLLADGAIWCDMNSVSPATKRAAAEEIEAAGAHYVDVAVMAPVHPARMAVPLLAAGPAAGEARVRLIAAGFINVRCVSEEIGKASAIKLIRSVMIKGTEALALEMMAAADAAGVAEDVLASLDLSDRPRPWTERAAYYLERATTHGLRRAAEMEESAATLRALGVEPVMTQGTIRRQREAALPAKDKDAA